MSKQKFVVGGLVAAASVAFAVCGASTTHAATGTQAVNASFAIRGTQAMTDTHAMSGTMAMHDMSKMTVGQMVLADKQFSTLAKLVKLAGLTSTFAGRGPITVFAPTNDAFAKLPKATLDALAKDPKKLKAVLLYHVSQGKVNSEMVKAMSGVEMPKMVGGGEVKFALQDGVLYANEAKVITADIVTKNGVVHVIDTVLTDTHAMSDKAAMTDTKAMSGTMAMSDTHAMSGTMAMSDTHAMTGTMAMSDTHAMSDTKAMAGMMMLSGGKFYKVEETAQGTASLVKSEAGKVEIHIEGFKVKNGPNLHIYLTSLDPVPFKEGLDLPDAIDLGALKATSGDQTYAVPASVDLSKVKTVVVWCQDFKVGFVAASLAPSK